MAFATILKPPTVLEQLLEEINFQRTKEMRQLMTDDSEFVMLQGTTYWTDLFVRHFLFQNESTIDCDDLLFFVRKKHVKGTPRYLPKFETEVDVFRKDSRKLPIGDPDIDWEETVYLNLIIHQFEYTLTLAICTRTSPKELQVLKRHSQKVYASPSRRRMDTKGEVEEITYPHVCFMVDNFDEVFQDILVRDGEMVCVELVAADRTGSIQGVIFLGSIRYDALKKVYDARQSSLSSKMAQRMMFGLFSNVNSQRCEFVRMKGPQGKGHAEMAVTKPKGSGVETPTSEPGFCATDMWDDWEDDANEEYFTFRQQRRLSDPSANINNFVRGGWKTKLDVKSRSECEGLDSMDNGVSEIEGGDLRDDEVSGPTSTIATIKISTAKSSCCGCFQRPAVNCCASRSRASSIALTDICARRPCNTPHACAVRSPLGPPEHHCNCNLNSARDLKTANANYTEFEVADDAIILNETEHISHMATPPSNTTYHETSLTECAAKPFVTVHGKEELPFVQEEDEVSSISPPAAPSNNAKTDSVQIVVNRTGIVKNGVENDAKVCDSNSNNVQTKPIACSTLPKRKNSMNRKNKFGDKQQLSPPKRITPDGTHIYYWCDMSKKHPSELDDGAYNPLWTMRGFTQTFHFWKENKRAQSVPLNAFLTYVTLPWWSIAKDILDHREGPILTF